jgi:hypothetical protein
MSLEHGHLTWNSVAEFQRPVCVYRKPARDTPNASTFRLYRYFGQRPTPLRPDLPLLSTGVEDLKRRDVGNLLDPPFRFCHSPHEHDCGRLVTSSSTSLNSLALPLLSISSPFDSERTHGVSGDKPSETSSFLILGICSDGLEFLFLKRRR